MNKKTRSYVEFLYILPFLLIVLLFSYFPLYGWRYPFKKFWEKILPIFYI